MGKWVSLVAVFSVSAVASGILVSERVANANFRRTNAAQCNIYSQTAGANIQYDGFGGISSIGAAGTSGIFVCPVEDDSTVGKAAMSGLYVDAYESAPPPYNSSTAAQVAPCLLAYDHSAAFCTGSPVQASQQGWNSLSMNLTDWHNASFAGWYPTLEVKLPNGSSLTGWLAIQ